MTASKISIANEEIAARLSSVWPSAYDIAWPGTPFDVAKRVKDKDTWARYTIQHSLGEQASLSDVAGKRRFDRGGTVIIQVFTPLNKGMVSAYDAAEIVVNAYEGKTTPSGVWFRNVRINEVESVEKSWQQINVIIDFTYDQIH